MIHQGIVNLKYITLVIQADSVQGSLIQLGVQLTVDNWSSGDHLFVKVQISTISR